LATFTPTEANYDIYEKEFLAVLKALEHWRAHLIWTQKLFIIKTDHKNLTYWKEPKKLTGRTARWHEKLQDYNFKIVHIPGKANGPADALSRKDQPEEEEKEKNTALIPPEAFINLFQAGDPGTLEHDIVKVQQKYNTTMKEWTKKMPIKQLTGPHPDDRWWVDGQG